MGMRFLLLFITLSALFLTLHARPDGSASKSETQPLNLRSRTLLSNADPEKSIADPPAGKEPESADDDETETAAEAPESRKLGRRHSTDKSVAGGGVIIGGLVTAILAAVYCYIRVTRKRPADSLT